MQDWKIALAFFAVFHYKFRMSPLVSKHLGIVRYVYGFIFVLCFAPLAAAEPYTAVITADGVAVRSGPGSEFYPTLQLRTGDSVEIYYERGEWYAIRPPVGSFSWVSGKFVDFSSGNIGTVLTDGLAARIGSDYSDDCETVQVTLKKGETVLILERRETPENFSSPVWLKIAPPSGEFRWIHQSALHSSIRQVRHDATGVQEPPSVQPIQTAQPNDGTASEIPAPALPKVASAQPFAAARKTALEMPGAEPFQRAFRELQRETYVVMTRPADDEVFAVLIQRAEELHQIAPTDLDLEKTYHMLESLQRTRAVRRELALRRPAAIGAIPTGTNQRFSPKTFLPQIPKTPVNPGTPAPQQPIVPAYTPTSAQSNSLPLRAGVNVGGYDIVGWLGEFDPLPQGHPPYAVVDEKGQKLCLISPSADLDLSPYIGQFVGINGVLGFYERQPGTPLVRHIIARSVVPK